MLSKQIKSSKFLLRTNYLKIFDIFIGWLSTVDGELSGMNQTLPRKRSGSTCLLIHLLVTIKRYNINSNLMNCTNYQLNSNGKKKVTASLKMKSLYKPWLELSLRVIALRDLRFKCDNYKRYLFKRKLAITQGDIQQRKSFQANRINTK